MSSSDCWSNRCVTQQGNRIIQHRQRIMEQMAESHCWCIRPKYTVEIWTQLMALQIHTALYHAKYSVIISSSQHGSVFYSFIFLQACIAAKRLPLPWWWQRLAQSLKRSPLNDAPRRVNAPLVSPFALKYFWSNSELLCMCRCRHRLAWRGHTKAGGEREMRQTCNWGKIGESRRTGERGSKRRDGEKRSSKQSQRIKMVIVDGARCGWSDTDKWCSLVMANHVEDNTHTYSQ